MPRPLLATSLLLLVFLVLTAGPARGQELTVQASVDQTTVGLEERLLFAIQVKGREITSLQTPEAPPTEGLALLQPTPNVQRSMSLVNGRLEQSISYRWVYRPLRVGEARIGTASVTVDGRTFETEPIDVTVVAQAQRPAGPGQDPRRPFVRRAPPRADDPTGSEPPEVSAEDLFIRATPNKREVYQGEQLTVTYELYFREGVQLRHSRLAGSWEAEGFWREELDVDQRPVPRSAVVDGLRYYVITLKRVALFPTRAGRLRVDPLQIESEAFVPARGGDPFARFFSFGNRFATVELSSPVVEVTVRPLPAPSPDGLDGVVGQYDVDLRVDRSDIEVGEAVEVTVEVRGSGNLATLPAPSLSIPGVFEQYDPQVSTTIERAGSTVRGRKSFTYLLVPRSNGTFEIGPPRLTYFDPARGSYRTAEAAAAKIIVTGTPLASSGAGATINGLPVDDIAGLLPADSRWERAPGTPLYRRTWPWVALTAPWLLLGLLVAARRRLRLRAADAVGTRSRLAHPAARKHLKRAGELIEQGDAVAFYEELERALLGFVGNRFNLAERGMTRPELDAALAERGVDEHMRAALRRLLDECDRIRFSPLRPDRAAMEEARARAGDLIADLDEAAARPVPTAP